MMFPGPIQMYVFYARIRREAIVEAHAALESGDHPAARRYIDGAENMTKELRAERMYLVRSIADYGANRVKNWPL